MVIIGGTTSRRQLIPLIPDISDAFGRHCRPSAVRRRRIKSTLNSSLSVLFLPTCWYI